MKPARSERRASFVDPRVDRKLRWTVAAFLALVAGIVGLNAHALGGQRGAALEINVMARQRALAERYIKDVLLVTHGYQADPSEDARSLLLNADALLNGGEVPAVQGADESVRILPVDDRLVAAKLREERRLLGELSDAGDRLASMVTRGPQFDRQVLTLRVIGAQLSSISNDAVGQMTEDAESAFARLVVIGIVLGLLGAAAAVFMGLVLRRVGARQSAKFRSLVQGASDLITVVDPGGSVMFQSPSLTRVLGIPPEEVLGTRYGALADEAGAQLLERAIANLAEEPGATETVQYRLHHRDGSWREVESIVTNLTHDPLVRGLVLNTRDVTERRTLEEELAHQAFHDSLTGLANRALFHDRVAHALARTRRQGEGIALVLLDLDGFKTVNDSLGHDAGDELLMGVAGRIQDCLRDSDTVARLGGDEFAILMEDQDDRDQSVPVTERILSALAEPYSIRGRDVFVRASAGIMLHLDAVGETAELIRNADTAMYAAKARGGGGWELFKPDMHQRAVRRLELEADLRGALAREEFVVHYQPIVDLSTGTVQATEALLRWQHPTRGTVMPNDFIPMAEETGLIVHIGYWVLREACRQTLEWRRVHDHVPWLAISVNLSARQIAERDIVQRVREVLEQTGLDPSALILEITEGTLVQGIGETALTLRALKGLGVRLAIDDFGTGSSSLGHLSHFPVDVLKIDKSFVDGLAVAGTEGTALVEAIVELAKTLRMSTIAEGIEMPEQLTELQTVGCRSGQGYLFARPMSAQAIDAFLEDRSRADALA